MEPERLKQWQGIFRDFVIVCVAAFMLVHETVANSTPRELVIGGALVLMGVPAALRADVIRRNNNGNGNGNGRDPEDRWSHLP